MGSVCRCTTNQKHKTNMHSIYKTNKCSDYTVIAGATLFPVHRVL